MSQTSIVKSFPILVTKFTSPAENRTLSGFVSQVLSSSSVALHFLKPAFLPPCAAIAVPGAYAPPCNDASRCCFHSAEFDVTFLATESRKILASPASDLPPPVQSGL